MRVSPPPPRHRRALCGREGGGERGKEVGKWEDAAALCVKAHNAMRRDSCLTRRCDLRVFVCLDHKQRVLVKM